MNDNVVIYIDGSSRPNPGKSGWGAHGYRYQNSSTNPRKLNDYYITYRGYLDKQEFKQIGTCVEPIEFYDFCMHEAHCETNNAAELHALYRVLDHFKDHKLSSLIIYTDSEYVRKGLTEYSSIWVRNNWKRADGKEIMYAAVWQKILEFEAGYKKHASLFDIVWVKGHSDTYGNILADRLAAIAALKGHTDTTYQSFITSSAQGYGKQEIEKHPLMCFKRMYFTSADHVSDVGRYFIAEPGDDDDIGRRMSNAAYSVVVHDKPDPIIEMIKQKQRYISNDVIRTVMLRLDRVFDKSIYPYLSTYGNDCLVNTGDYRSNLNFVDERQITSELTPVGLSFKAMETFAHLENILVQFKNQTLPDDYIVHDVTDQFFIQDGKKTVLDSKYVVGFKDMTIAVKQLNIPIILGYDLPHRNSLKRIETLDPKIKLIVWEESAGTYRYASIVEVSDAIGIWSNYHANRVIVQSTN